MLASSPAGVSLRLPVWLHSTHHFCQLQRGANLDVKLLACVAITRMCSDKMVVKPMIACVTFRNLTSVSYSLLQLQGHSCSCQSCRRSRHRPKRPANASQPCTRTACPRPRRAPAHHDVWCLAAHTGTGKAGPHGPIATRRYLHAFLAFQTLWLFE